MSIKFLVLGGGGYFGLLGEGERRFYFYGRADFSDLVARAIRNAIRANRFARIIRN